MIQCRPSTALHSTVLWEVQAGMHAADHFIIPPMSARAFTVEPRQTVRIVDVGGRQPGDFVAFRSDDLSAAFSQARTRVENRRVRVTTGHVLWTNTQPPQPMFTIVADTCGAHDLLYTPCCRYALEKRFGVFREGCLENLVKALEPWDVPIERVPDPLNLFFAVTADPSGHMAIQEPPSKSGDYIELRAEVPCIVAISTCSVPSADRENSAYEVRVSHA